MAALTERLQQNVVVDKLRAFRAHHAEEEARKRVVKWKELITKKVEDAQALGCAPRFTAANDESTDGSYYTVIQGKLADIVFVDRKKTKNPRIAIVYAHGQLYCLQTSSSEVHDVNYWQPIDDKDAKDFLLRNNYDTLHGSSPFSHTKGSVWYGKAPNTDTVLAAIP